VHEQTVHWECAKTSPFARARHDRRSRTARSTAVSRWRWGRLGRDLHSNYGPTADTGSAIQSRNADDLRVPDENAATGFGANAVTIRRGSRVQSGRATRPDG